MVRPQRYAAHPPNHPGGMESDEDEGEIDESECDGEGGEEEGQEEQEEGGGAGGGAGGWLWRKKTMKVAGRCKWQGLEGGSPSLPPLSHLSTCLGSRARRQGSKTHVC